MKWDFKNIIMAHGEIMKNHNTRELFEEAWYFITYLKKKLIIFINKYIL